MTFLIAFFRFSLRRVFALLALGIALGGLAACDTPLRPVPEAQIPILAAGVGLVRFERHYDVNCSVFNILETGEVCQHKYKPTDRQEVFCYRTLGQVDCYAERDPYRLAGRALPAQPTTMADPRMPMQPREDKLRRVVERVGFDNETAFDQQAGRRRLDPDQPPPVDEPKPGIEPQFGPQPPAPQVAPTQSTAPVSQ
jgi:hypothetical protein